MSFWSTLNASANAALLRHFGQQLILQPLGAPATTFAGIRPVRQPIENGASAAFERVWTTTSELPVTPKAGATVLLGSIEYSVHDVKPDEDSESNGTTIYLNRKKPLNA